MSCSPFIICLLLSCSALFACSDALLADVPKCKEGDDACMTEAVQLVLSKYAKTGVKEFGLVSLDPLHVKKLQLAKNVNSPVSVDMTFTDVDLLGLSDAKVKSLSGFNKELSKTIELEAFLPKITLKGPYVVDGKVLILPIVGKGIGQFVLENSRFHISIKAKPIKGADGQTHVEVLNVKLQIEPSRVIYKLEGLFNGQKDLSDNMHTFINENWSDIFNELKPDITEGMGLIFKHVLNHAFAKCSIESLFIDE